MNAKMFVDTNVLIYAHDVDAQGALSIQVLQEFYVNVTRKIASPLSKASARTIVNSYAVWCIDTTLTEISVAFQIEAKP